MFEFINSKEGMDSVSPDAFKFNTTWKSGLRLALRFVKIPEDYTKQFTGNAKVLWEIFKDYRVCEGISEKPSDDLHPNSAPQAKHRYDILSKAIPAAIIIYFFDSAYREVGDRFLYLIIQNQHRFKFPPHHIDSSAWFRAETNTRHTPGVVIPGSQIVSADENAIVVREVLPPKKYFASIEGIDHWVSIDSNRPVWAGTGWAYHVHAVYGTAEELETKTLLGE